LKWSAKFARGKIYIESKTLKSQSKTSHTVGPFAIILCLFIARN